jgi:pyrroloquinoline-quinone synthase
VDEEQGPNNHPELWMRFAEGLGETRSAVREAQLLPETRELVDTFLQGSQRSYADALGTLFAYEHQIPEIATFKIDALKKHYAVQSPATLEFFEVHREADIYHTRALSNLLDELPANDKVQAEKTAKIAADQLWKFLDGIHRTMSV